MSVTIGGGLAAILLLVLIPYFPALAETQSGSAILNTAAAASGLSTSSVPIIVARIIRVLLGVLGIILVCWIIYCGWLYLTSHGEVEKIKKAGKIFSSSAIGLLLVFGSFSLTTFILNKLLEMAGIGNTVSTSSVNYSEPLSGSLGSGIIESHYPARNAIDIPRNTRVMITFKDEIEMESMIKDYADTVEAGSAVFNLNTDNILIYKTGDVSETANSASVALTSAEVAVSFNGLDYNADSTVDAASYTRLETEGTTIFVFDPPLLGNTDEDTNYTIFLSPNILKADGSSAFDGIYNEGYEWSFTVSTEIDLTPPHVTSVSPVANNNVLNPRNSVIQINFNEAMDPVAGTGTYHLDDPDDDNDISESFTNIMAKYTTSQVVTETMIEGSYEISNSYRTIEFVSEEPCGRDPCGNTIYCLPASANVNVTGKAAPLSSEPPQAATTGGLFQGLVDAAGNSLDGSGPQGVYDGVAAGPEGSTALNLPSDNYSWRFLTSAVSNTDPPQIISLSPNPNDREDFAVNQDITITFNTTMWSSTLNSDNIRLVPNHTQELWYFVQNEELPPATSPTTMATVGHGALWQTDVDAAGNQIFYYYYPVITQGIRGLNQICLNPATGPAITNYTPATCVSSGNNNCCDGRGSSTACRTMGATGETAKDPFTLGQ
ncbi:MAG: Ig-like domain-containing protein [Candidatus Uhrbacteria bacterium]